MNSTFEAIQNAGKIQERKIAALERGFDPNNPKKYNILFIGDGGITGQGLNFIASNLDKFLFDIDNIYIAGRHKEGSTQHRKHIVNNAQQVARVSNKHVNIVSKQTEELSDLLHDDKSDIVFFTLDANSKDEYDRSKLSANNISLVEQIAPYIDPSFAGNFNFVSNLPAILAAKASELFPIDARQITANIPLDLLRAESFLHQNFIYKEEDFSGFELAMAGFHDQMIPLLKHSRILTGHNVSKKEIQQNFKRFDEYLKQFANLEHHLRTFVGGNAAQSYELDNKYLEAKGYTRQQGATITPTGAGILRLTEAIINREKTIVGIPKEINGTWYYVHLPVDFKRGYAEEDTEITNNFTTEEKNLITSVITTPPITGLPKSLNTIIAETETSIGNNIFVRPPQATTTELEEKFGRATSARRYLDEATKKDLREEDLIRILQNNFNVELGLISDHHPHSFYFFKYENSLQPTTARSYQVHLGDMNYDEQRKLLDRTTITKIQNNKEHVFVAATSKSKQKKDITARIQSFQKNNGNQEKDILTYDREKPYFIEDMITQDRNIVVLANIGSEQLIESFDKKGRQQLNILAPDNIYGLAEFKGEILLIGSENIYQLERNKIVPIAPNLNGNEFEIIEDKNLILTTNAYETNIVNLKTGKIVTYDTTNNIGSFISDKKAIQLVTQDDDGFVIRDFKNMERLFSKEGVERFLRESHLTNPWKAFIPIKDVLVTFHDNKVYATSHKEHSKPYTAKLTDIKDFSKFGGFFEK